MILYTRITNLVLSVCMIMASLVSLLTTPDATTGVLACYVLVFSCLLCCFETHLKQISKIIALKLSGLPVNGFSVYPNPFVSYTEFWFSHNRPFEPLEVQVQVMTITGKIVWTKNQTITTDGFLSREITWDGKDDFGDRIGKGVYVYKLTVKSTLSDKKAEKIEKLVIL